MKAAKKKSEKLNWDSTLTFLFHLFTALNGSLQLLYSNFIRHRSERPTSGVTEPSFICTSISSLLVNEIHFRFSRSFRWCSSIRCVRGVCDIWYRLRYVRNLVFRLLLARLHERALNVITFFGNISHRPAARDLHKAETCDLLEKFALEKLIVRAATCLALSDVFWLIVRWRFALELCHSRILPLVEWMRTICLPRSRLCVRESAVGTEEFQCQLMQRTFDVFAE